MHGQHTVSLDQQVPIVAAGASASFFVPSLAVVRHWSADARLVQVCSESTFAAVAISVSLNTEWIVVFYWDFLFAGNTFSVDQFVAVFADFAHLFAAVDPFGVDFSLDVDINVFGAVVNRRQSHNDLDALSSLGDFIASFASSTHAISVSISTVSGQGDTFKVGSQVITINTFLTNLFTANRPLIEPFSFSIYIPILGAVILILWSRNNWHTFSLTDFISLTTFNASAFGVNGFAVFGEQDANALLEVITWNTFEADLFAAIEPFAVMFALDIGISVFQAVRGNDGFLDWFVDRFVDWPLDDDWCFSDTGDAFFMGVELVIFVTLDTFSVVIESLTVTVAFAIISVAGHWSRAAYTFDGWSITWVTWEAGAGFVVPGGTEIAHLSA